MKVISLWVKNPVSSWSRDKALDGVEYETKHRLLSGVCNLDEGGGFVLQKVASPIVTIVNNTKIVEYAIICKTVYQETHADVNQASWNLILHVAEAINE